MRHCDIYATNIVVRDNHAKLIDWESAVSETVTDIKHSPTHTPEVDHTKVPLVELDARCTASTLWFLWDTDATSFDRKKHVEHVQSGSVATYAYEKFVCEIVI